MYLSSKNKKLSLTPTISSAVNLPRTNSTTYDTFPLRIFSPNFRKIALKVKLWILLGKDVKLIQKTIEKPQFGTYRSNLCWSKITFHFFNFSAKLVKTQKADTSEVFSKGLSSSIRITTPSPTSFGFSLNATSILCVFLNLGMQKYTSTLSDALLFRHC